ncbi:insulinase family protein [bacterium]|nr:insulinase family protein [bacterium]
MICLTCQSYGPAAAAKSGARADGALAESFTLGNGLKVIVRPKAGSPVVTVQVWYRVGSYHERVGIRGIAHLFEHMMFRGSEHFGPEEHSRLIQNVGGYDNAFTAEDMTVYHQTLPARHLELPFKLEADRMRSLKLDSAILNTEREVVKEEFHQSLNNPFSRAYLEFRRRLFPGHPYAWTPLGDLEDLNQISVQDCLDFYNAHYAPNHAVLVVSGNVKAAEVRSLAEKYFGPLKPSGSDGSYGQAFDLSTPPAEKRIALRLDLELPVVTLAYHIPPAAHEDIPALEVLTAILSDGESSRLYRSMVRESKLAVHAMGSTILQKDPGLYGVGAAFLPNRDAGEIEAGLRREIRRVRDDGVTRRELEKAVNQALAEEVFGGYSVDHLAHGMGESEILEGDYRRFETVVRRYRSLTPEQIRDVAVKYLTEDREIVLIAEPLQTNWLYYAAGWAKSIADAVRDWAARIFK